MIYLLRHGLDDESKIGGYIDVALTKDGIIEVEKARNFIEENIEFQKIFSSDLKRTLDGDSTYYITVKKNDYGKERIITEEKIDKKTYERLLEQKDVINKVNKERVSFVYDDNIYKLDHFEDDTYILEALENSKIPPFIDLIEDVTLDDNYYNANINSSCVLKKSL